MEPVPYAREQEKRRGSRRCSATASGIRPARTNAILDVLVHGGTFHSPHGPQPVRAKMTSSHILIMECAWATGSSPPQCCCSSLPCMHSMGSPESTILRRDYARRGGTSMYGTGAGLPILVSDDGWAWRRAGTLMQALPGGRPGPDVIARGGNNTWAPDVIRVGERTSLTIRAGHATQVCDRPAGRQDARSGFPGLQMGGRRSGRLVRRRRGQQCHRPGRVSRSHDRVALALCTVPTSATSASSS